jgi:hypothetical protein
MLVRGRRMRIAVVGALVAVGALAGVLLATVGADTSKEPATFARKAQLRVAAGPLEAPTALSRLSGRTFVSGKGRGGSGRLGGRDEVLAALTGSLVPVAVEASDGSLVAYSAWHQIARVKPDEPGQGIAAGQPVGIPSVRLFAPATGEDRLLERGAHSPALALDGRLAFVRAMTDAVRAGEPYEGHIVVGRPFGGGGAFERWTTAPARYFPYAWAGDVLLVYRAVPGSEATDLYAFEGPARSRLLAAGAFVVALSPDAERALVTVGRRMVQIVRIADAAIEASLALDGDGVASSDSPSTPHYLMYSGSWRGDRVIASSDRGLVVLDVRDGLRVESILATPDFPHGITEPSFVDDTRVVGWADLAGGARPVGEGAEPAWDHALVSCDLVAGSCTAGASHPARSWARWISNPSR